MIKPDELAARRVVLERERRMDWTMLHDMPELEAIPYKRLKAMAQKWERNGWWNAGPSWRSGRLSAAGVAAFGAELSEGT